MDTNKVQRQLILLEKAAKQGEREQEAAIQPMRDVTREQLALGKRFLHWRTILPLIAVFVGLLLFVQKANIDIGSTWAAICHANPVFYLLAFGIYYLSFPVRAARWRLLLQNVGITDGHGIRLPNFWKITEIVYISFFANAVVPIKLGDLYRAYLLRREIGVSTTRSFGTVVAERLLDLVVLLLLFIPAIIVSLHKHLPAQLQLSLEVLLVAVIAGAVSIFVLKLARERIAQWVPLRFRDHYYHFHAGTLGSFRRIPLLVGQTTVVWICEALRFFFVALSLSLLHGSFLHCLTAAIFIGLGVALLTAVPATGGGIGLVEGGMIAMIALFYQGPNAVNLTAAAIILDRSITLFSVLAFGLPIFLLTFRRKVVEKSAL